jgi:hypothetical protein
MIKTYIEIIYVRLLCYAMIIINYIEFRIVNCIPAIFNGACVKYKDIATISRDISFNTVKRKKKKRNQGAHLVKCTDHAGCDAFRRAT